MTGVYAGVYADMQACRIAGMQTCRCRDAGMHADMQTYAEMQKCRHADMQKLRTALARSATPDAEKCDLSMFGQMLHMIMVTRLSK